MLPCEPSLNLFPEAIILNLRQQMYIFMLKFSAGQRHDFYQPFSSTNIILVFKTEKVSLIIIVYG